MNDETVRLIFEVPILTFTAEDLKIHKAELSIDNSAFLIFLTLLINET